ncbi:GIY-YIG nuclease family protein [Niallia taxi]|uniref:GIY-YIG nuclease family protein n=1 Tax=Niallia taxi TaxID=2499688 RepID=UPI0015F6F7C3|nr:GIY-YIG nuclease family protein [Niallia taxi]
MLNLSRSEFARASIVKEIKRMDKKESVYLARAVGGIGIFEREDGGGLYKIGRSKDPVRRLAQLNSPSTKLPYTLELVCSFESANADLTERMLQKYFESKATPNSHEYFMLSSSDVQLITMRSFPPEIIHSIYQEYA